MASTLLLYPAVPVWWIGHADHTHRRPYSLASYVTSCILQLAHVYRLGSSSGRGHEKLCSFESLTSRLLRCVYGVWGAGVSPAEVDHQVQLPRPANALREKHHTAGKKSFRIWLLRKDIFTLFCFLYFSESVCCNSQLEGNSPPWCHKGLQHLPCSSLLRQP